jgi:DNA-binding PadR family transcriptional regulator
MPPSSKVQFLVLCALIRFPMHPYAIRQEIIELTGHYYFPSQSTIQRALGKLLSLNHIEECASNPYYWLKAKRGAPYELTESGCHQVKRELRMYRELTDITRIWLQYQIDVA